jgi:hypothetical protein
MNYSAMTPLLLGCMLLAGCAEGSSPTEVASPDLAVAGNSGCYTPKFTVTLVPINDFLFAGVVTGDLEGTVALEFDPGSIKFAGVTLSNSGIAHWEISGGIIPTLGDFATEFSNRNLLTDRSGSPATLFENIGNHRATGGVSMANLTYLGAFTVVPSPEAVLEFQGVICL